MARQEALNTAVARLLVQNNESEQEAAVRANEIYDHVQQQVYVFLTATLTVILVTSLYLIRSNRELFARLEVLSGQRSELAQKLISTQESTLRYISRELHDEFGQILTAIGSILGRAGSQAPEGSRLRADLREVREIAQSTLDNVRSLSQALHPVILDEAGLESTLDWYIPTVERQTGLVIGYEKSGIPFPINGSAGIHIYRVLQEALNNVADSVLGGPRSDSCALELEVEDHGTGIGARSSKHTIGLVAMRERAELLGGTIEFLQPTDHGTLVRLRIPREQQDSYGR